MKTELSGQMRGVSLLGGSAIVLRVFSLVAIDAPEAWSASWLSVLLGGLLAAPALLPVLCGRGRAVPGARRMPAAWPGRAACALLGVMSLCDAAFSARLFAALVGYVALTDHSVTALAAPLLACALLACLMGVGALNASAVIWRRAALALAVLTALLQLREMEPGWIMPILGPGWPQIARGALRAAGLTAHMLLGMYLLAGDEPGRLAATLPKAIALCAGAVLLFGLLIPAMPDAPASRLFRIELLADSGRNGFATELIYVLMIFGGTLLVSFELMTAAAALHAVAPRLPAAACVAMCAAALAALAFSGQSGQAQALRATALFYPMSLAAAALASVQPKGEAA